MLQHSACKLTQGTWVSAANHSLSIFDAGQAPWLLLAILEG